MTERIGGRLGDKVRVEDAQERFEREKANLFRADGSQIYSEDEHKERLGALTRERNATLKQAEEEVRGEMTALDEKVAHIKNRDAAELLTHEELKTANNRRAFAVDAAQTLGVEELAGRLKSVLSTGDKGAIFAYWNAGERRKREIASSRPAGRAGASSATELDGVLTQMRKVLDPSVETEIEAARERKEQAVQLQVLAGSLQQGGRSPLEVYQRQAYSVPERTGLRAGQ
jgi:hypothetical protein